MSLPDPDFDTTPYNTTITIDWDAAEAMVEAADGILNAFTQDGPDAVTPHAIALAQMVKDHLG